MPDISKWKTSNITNINFIFQNCLNLIKLPDISKWDVTNLIKAESIFKGCELLTNYPDISKWNINTEKFEEKSLFEYSNLVNSQRSGEINYSSESKFSRSFSSSGFKEKSIIKYNILPFEFKEENNLDCNWNKIDFYNS